MTRPSTDNTSSDARAIVQLLIGATMISFSPVFVRIADVGPSAAGVYRTLFAAVFLVAVVLARREALWRGRRPFLLALGAGAFFAADLTFWHRSIFYVGPGLSTLLGNLQIFFLAAFGLIVFRERADWRFFVSLPLAFTGLFLLVGVDWASLDSGYKLGVLFGLFTALTYAGYVLVLQRSQSEAVRLSAAANLAMISLVTAGIMSVETVVVGESFRIPNAKSWVAMIAYGVICHSLGWIIISRALARIQASRAGLILLLQPTLAFVWDVMFFARPTGATDIAGALITLAAIYLGTSRRR